jgi:hypothetical protein
MRNIPQGESCTSEAAVTPRGNVTFFSKGFGIAFAAAAPEGTGCSMPRLHRLLSAVATTFFLAGCASSIAVSSHVARDLDFSRYRSFDWGPADALPTGDPRLDRDPFFTDRLQGAVERHLADRGIALSRSEAPDLLIHYHANIRERLDVDGIDHAHGYCDPANCPPTTTTYEAGTLVLDVVDARTNRLVWRGWAQHSVEDMLHDPDRMTRTIDRAVTAMLKRLPPL